VKILIADDNPLDLSVLKLTLEKWDYEVTTASDGNEALNIMSQDDAPALAILDWMMPGMTGLEVCAELRFQHTKRYMYILILSSRSEKSDIISGMQSGADDYLEKPVDVNELQVRLRAGRRIIELQEDLIAAREELRVQATQDFLTGISNRLEIMTFLGRELSRASRTHGNMAVMMADIDTFKKINDTYGHPSGDAVIKEVAARIGGCLREYDSVGRFGGEEFLIVVVEIDPENIKGLADRIRKSIADTPIPIPNAEITVTMSFGAVAYAAGEPVNKDDLIARADAALYRAKDGGRNRVEMAEPLGSETT
jgi:diguanylate cyclase (GGDEF)-like protein